MGARHSAREAEDPDAGRIRVNERLIAGVTAIVITAGVVAAVATLPSGDRSAGTLQFSPSPTPVAPPPEKDPDEDWVLVFSDEFTGTELDRSTWTTHDQSTFGDGNEELACLMDRPENVAVAGGLLTITAQREDPRLDCGPRDDRFPRGRSFSSGFIETKGKRAFEYGRFEISVKSPTTYGTSKGLWPAFWLRPENGGLGEIDVFELSGTSPGEADTSARTLQSIHYDYENSHPVQNSSFDLERGTFDDGFHTHVLEWEPGMLRWYVDGEFTYERTINTTAWLNQAFTGPFHLRLNLAVGGDWAGSPDATTQFPAQLQVDYIRVYQRP